MKMSKMPMVARRPRLGETPCAVLALLLVAATAGRMNAAPPVVTNVTATQSAPMQPVDIFAPNGYGVYDMAGNVMEWTWDWYDGTWYGKAGATQSDTRGPASGTYRGTRGGTWCCYASVSRCARRCNAYPTFAASSSGYRCVRGL